MSSKLFTCPSLELGNLLLTVSSSSFPNGAAPDITVLIDDKSNNRSIPIKTLRIKRKALTLFLAEIVIKIQRPIYYELLINSKTQIIKSYHK